MLVEPKEITVLGDSHCLLQHTLGRQLRKYLCACWHPWVCSTNHDSKCILWAFLLSWLTHSHADTRRHKEFFGGCLLVVVFRFFSAGWLLLSLLEIARNWKFCNTQFGVSQTVATIFSPFHGTLFFLGGFVLWLCF